MKTENFDILIVGAGVSGIGAACHLKKKCPGKSFGILERRHAIGGTWDLFRYPGIRSDSDMLTYGYDFRPWLEPKILAAGPAIKQYLIDTAREYEVDRSIRFGLKVTKYAWSTSEAKWTVEALHEQSGEMRNYTCSFLINCTGYFNHDAGYRPEFPGEKKFTGTIIHPQHWPEDLDYRGKKIVVIGSGATAVTLVPAMADTAAHVTMLQRSPGYIASIPAVDAVSKQLSRFLPARFVYYLARLRNIAIQRFTFWFAKERPAVAKRFLLGMVRRQLGSEQDMKNFTPQYKPWDQRLCVIPDGDLFAVIKRGRASVVTDQIKEFIPTGIKLESGKLLEADIIITATGFEVQMLGGAVVEIDGNKRELSQILMYKSVLCEGIPNAALILGYTNASWTLKVDIASEYICRLINHMDKNGYRIVVARDREGCLTDETVMGGLDSGYLRRAIGKIPRQGSKGVWRVSNDYASDTPMLRSGNIDDGILEFSGAA